MQPDYTRFLIEGGLRGARLGVARKYMGANQAVDQLIAEAIAVLKQQGAEIVDPIDLPQEGIGEGENEVLLYEFKADLNTYLASRGQTSQVKTLADVIAFNDQHREQEMPWFGQELMLMSQAKGSLSEKGYRDALEKSKKHSRQDGIDAALARDRLDAIIAPTAGPSWITDWVNGDHDTGGCSTPAAVAGYPHITVPAGFVHGLPVGLSFFASAWSEPKLITLAYGYEQAAKQRREPYFLASVKLTAPSSPRT